MSDLARVKANIASMINQGAPESDIDAYVASEGLTADQLHSTTSAPASPPSQTPVASDPQAIFQSLVHQESEGHAGIKGPPTKYGQALGLTQLLPGTAEQMAKKIGVPWHPELLSSKDDEGRKYQALLGAAYYDEGLTKYGNDPRKALMYYHGGPDERQWGPKTQWYANAVLARASGQPIPDPPAGAVDSAPQASQATPDRMAEIASANAGIRQMLMDGATDEQVNAFAGQHGLKIKDGQLAAFRKTGSHSVNVDYAGDEKPQDQPPAPEGPSYGHTSLEATKSLGRGLVDTLAQAPGAIAYGITGNPQISGAVDNAINPIVHSAYDTVAGPADPQSTLEKYTNAASRGVGQMAVPGGATGSKARAALAALGLGVGSGVSGQAAADSAGFLGVDPDKARIVGQIAGGVVAGAPLGGVQAAKAYSRYRYINKAAADPRGVYLPGAAESLATKAADEAPNGIVPKGRAKLTVQQINAVANQHLVGMETDLTRLSKSGMIDAQKADELKRAIQRKNGITSNEINALRGTPEGDAVAEALLHYRAVNSLTKPFGGSKPGVLPMLAEMGTNIALPVATGNPLMAATGTILRKLVRAYPGDVNASRIRGADKAIDNLKTFQKLGEKVGPSPVGPAIDTFKQRVGQSYADEAAARDAEQAQREAISAERQGRADLKASRYGMTDRDFASYSARKSAADEALASTPPEIPTSRSAKALSALKRLEQTNRSSELRFDQRLQKATAPPKRAPIDLSIKANIDRNIYGNHNLYADSLGVKRSDVETALKKVDTSDIDPFEMEKFTHGYSIGRKTYQALMPRLRKALDETGVKPLAAKNSPAKASPVTEGATENLYRPVEDQARYAEGKSKAVKNQLAERAAMERELPPEITDAIRTDVDHMIETSRSAESALRYFDQNVAPRLGGEADKVRSYIQRIVSKKRYETDAQFETGALRK